MGKKKGPESTQGPSTESPVTTRVEEERGGTVDRSRSSGVRDVRREWNRNISRGPYRKNRCPATYGLGGRCPSCVLVLSPFRSRRGRSFRYPWERLSRRSLVYSLPVLEPRQGIVWSCFWKELLPDRPLNCQSSDPRSLTGSSECRMVSGDPCVYKRRLCDCFLLGIRGFSLS